MRKKNIAKKLTVMLLAVILLVVSLAQPCSAAVTYPEGITAEKALSAVDKTDVFINSLCKQMKNTTLKGMVLPQIYSSETLSALLTGLYGAMTEYESDLKTAGIDMSTATVAKGLSDYPEVSAAVAGAATWDAVNLTDVDWGVSTKAEFVSAAAAMFSTFDNLLYMLLCSGTFKINNLISIEGDNGYENAIVPVLENLGCSSITDETTFKNDAKENKNSMVEHIFLDILAFLEKALDAPAKALTKNMPNIAYFIQNGGLDDVVNKLVKPVKLKVFNLLSILNGTSLMGLMGFVEDSSETTSTFGDNINTTLASFTEGSGFTLAEMNLDELASCGTVTDGKVEANQGDAYILIMSWLLDTVKLNKDKVTELVGDTEEIGNAIGGMMEKDTAELLKIFINLLTGTTGVENNYQWTFADVTPVTVNYTANLGQEKYQRVLDGIDSLINEFVAEYGGKKTFKDLAKSEIYSNSVVSKLVSAVYSFLGTDYMAQFTDILSISSKPSALAEELIESQYSSTRAVLNNYSSWKKVPTDNLSWGFKDGDKEGFMDALTAAFRPFFPVLRMLLAGDKIELMGLEIYGSNGYNTAIIPLLEALGCKADTIKTYEQYKKTAIGDEVVLDIISPICSLVDRVLKKPVYTLTSILPNIVYFLNNSGINTMVENLIYPVTNLLSQLGISDMLDLSAVKDLDVMNLLSESIASISSDIVLPKADLKQFAGMGTASTVESKRTYDGQPATITYVTADKTAVLITLLRYLVEVMKTPGNENLLSGMMGGDSAGENDMFATYSSGITDQMSAMSTDETIEWLYKLLFRERAVSSATSQEEYAPTIIYQKKLNVKKLVSTIITLVVILGAIAALIYWKRRQLKEFFEELNETMKKRKSEKTTPVVQEV